MAKRLLFVDDEPDILKVIKFRFEKLGYEVLTAVNGQEALDRTQKEMPDLILLDLRLPVINGYDVCKRIKSDEKLKHIPVIIFTASVGKNMEEKTRELGADGYVTKPFEPEVLMEKIKKLLKEEAN